MNEERGTLTHRLPDNMRIEMPINLYKKILGIPFEKKEETQAPQEMSSETRKKVLKLFKGLSFDGGISEAKMKRFLLRLYVISNSSPNSWPHLI